MTPAVKAALETARPILAKLKHQEGDEEAARALDLVAEALNSSAVPRSPWISTEDRLPDRGQLIVKRWKNGATWAGVYSGSEKDSSFDAWFPLPLTEE
jgi:hypothetical protein